MRVLITGSREWTNKGEAGQRHVQIMRDVFTRYIKPSSVVVNGGAGGADSMAGLMAIGAGHFSETHEADWKNCSPLCPIKPHRKRNAYGEYCPMAGHNRNQLMVDLGADLVLAFKVRGAGNRGTEDCIRRAKLAGIEVVEVWDDEHNPEV